MARHPKTTLWMLIKVVLKKRYVRVEKGANGRYIPAVIGQYEPGSYYLRYTLNGKRTWESVGSDLNIALKEQKARQASLERVPSATVTTLRTSKTVADATAKFIASKNGEDRHAQRRARSWKWLLDLFSNWWDKTYIDEFIREDFQAFQKYLAKKGRQPRTQYNLLRSLVTFFRASGHVVLFARDEQEATILAATVVVKNTLILVSADMPKFTKCKVTPYTEEQLDGLFAVAIPWERLFMSCFLFTGIAYSPSDRLSLFNSFSRNHLSSSWPYQFLAILRKLRKRLCLQARIDGLPFEGKHSEDAFVDSTKRVLADKSCSRASIPRANSWSDISLAGRILDPAWQRHHTIVCVDISKKWIDGGIVDVGKQH